MEDEKIILNKTARKRRHQRLYGTRYVTLKKCISRVKGRKEIAEAKRIQSSEDKKAIHSFTLKVACIALTLFVVNILTPTYVYSQEIVNDYYDGSIGFELEDVATTNQGFLINTIGQSQAGDRSEMVDTISYVVEPGDTLSSIASKFRLKVATIAWANGIYNPNQLKVGANLIILPVDGVLHKVKDKDTLASIAKQYKVDSEKIQTQNKLDGDIILAGNNLIIPGGKPKAIETPTPATRTTIGRAPTPNNPAPAIAPPSSSSAGTYNGGTISLIWPTAGKITQSYHRGHYALDIANVNKGPIFASASGKVIKSSYGWNGGYGNYIIVDHGGGLKTLYAHNEELYVQLGDYVTQGQTIAWMGNSGRVYGRTGIHLHFEVILNGVKKNPLSYF